METKKQKMNMEFMRTISECKDPVVFIGLAKLLKVRVSDEKNEPKDFTDIFAETVKAYDAAPKKRRKELLEILKRANVQDLEESNGRAENTETK